MTDPNFSWLGFHESRPRDDDYEEEELNQQLEDKLEETYQRRLQELEEQDY